MKYLIVSLSLLTNVFPTFAAIGGGYHGADKNKDYRVYINEDQGINHEKSKKLPKQFEHQYLYDIEVYKTIKTKKGFKFSEKPIIFKALLCGYEVLNKNDGYDSVKTHFVCEKKLGYPLSGAKYKITPPVVTQGLTAEEEYERCKQFLKEDYESLTCIANCKSSKFTPRKMTAGAYECE